MEDINEYLSELPFDLPFDTSMISSIIKGALVVLLIILLVGLIIYILTSVFLNKMNKRMYGKGTALAWLPICKTYLLGKLTFGPLVGWLLIIVSALTGISIGGESILPENLNSIVSTLYGVIVIFLWIYAFIKNGKLKKGNKLPQKEKAMQIDIPKEEVTPFTEDSNVPKKSIFENPHIEEELTTRQVVVHDEHVVKKPEVVEEPEIKEDIVQKEITTPEVLDGTQIIQEEPIKAPEVKQEENIRLDAPDINEVINEPATIEPKEVVNEAVNQEFHDFMQELNPTPTENHESIETLDIPNATALSDIPDDQNKNL